MIFEKVAENVTEIDSEVLGPFLSPAAEIILAVKGGQQGARIQV